MSPLSLACVHVPTSCACACELVCLWFEVWVHLRVGFRALFLLCGCIPRCLRAGFRAFFPCVAACRGACEWVQGVFSIVWLHNIWLLNIWRLLRSWGAIWKLVIAKKLLQRGYLEEWVLATPFSRTLSSRITFRSGSFYIRFQIWFILQQVFIKLDKNFSLP